ncbi:MAG TPA: glycosyltransferase [Pyrinomonadaceae bacterium]|nr:glycosyltransferase [Pyrinomonadaceae bacterium]
MKPRILQLIDSFDQGGSERQALELTRLLHDSGKYEVYLASLKPEGVLRAQIADLNLGDVPCYPLESFYDRNAITQLRRFVSYLRMKKIDLLHTHDFYTNIFGMTAGWLAGVEVRIASRRETSGLRSKAQQQAQRLAYSFAHRIVANSDSVRQKLVAEGVNEKRVTVIHNGLNLERVTARGSVSREEILQEVIGLELAGGNKLLPRHFVTIVANMRHEVKDYPTFLRMAQRVARAVPDVGFLLAGEGELQESLQRMAVEFGIAGNTFFLGRCENIAPLLTVSDVCVLSSKAEGFSNSILEYMAAGRPVVATDVGGAKEAIVEGETGYTVPPGNDRLMASAVVSLLRDPEKAKLLGQLGRRIVEQKFSSRALLQKTEALYESLLFPVSTWSSSDRATSARTGSSSDRATSARTGSVSVNQPLAPLRILVVGPSFDILGGQAVQAGRLIARLSELAGFEVGFLAINPRLPGVLRKLQSVKYLRTIVTSLLYIVNLLAQIPRYDVVHIFAASYFSFVIAPTPAILIARLFGKRILLNYHSGEAEDHLMRWRTAVPTIRLADEVVVPSEYLVRVLAKFGIGARAINNLIELQQFTFRERHPAGQPRPIFLSNRNLETHYGVDHVLRAFALIQQQVPSAELIVAGDGSRRANLERLALDLELRHTNFVGRVEHEEIVEQYQRADIYLNGSEIDNQPLSILEAFACGLPVVTTNAGGIPDMVSDGETGFVVKRGDHEAMASRAIQLLEEDGLADAITQKAFGECAQYSWDAVRDQWSQLYRELASRQLSDAQSPARAASNTNTEPGADRGPQAGSALGVADATGSKTDKSRASLSKVSIKKPFVKRLIKLRKMSIPELRIRSSQALAAFAERTGWSKLTKLPSDRAFHKLLHPCPNKDLLDHFRTRSTGFFSAFSERDAVIAELRSRWPEAEEQIIAQADRIVADRFDLLGFKDLSFGTPINWLLEPVSGKSVPALHWSRVDYLNAEVTGDKKIVWELNRHQYFLKLGQAYWLTQDERYADAFVIHLNSWMDQNPPKLGINWASSLEISFRSISWLWAFHYFQNSPALDSKTFTRALKFLYLNGRHLETYLSTYFSPNTHLTGEALGLVYLGSLLPEFKDAARWRTTGQKILIDQLERQVKADGVYFEQSSYYHRYTVDFYTHLLILSESPGLAGGPSHRPNNRVEEKLQTLLDHLMYITRPDGTSPLFGDDDGGRLVSLDRRPTNDFRAALSTGAVLFDRGDYKFVAGELAEETLWLLGVRGARAFDEMSAREPPVHSQGFPDGGYYVMRDGWHSKASYLLFDCGPHGTSNCGHAHADALAIEVAANGRPMLIDPGTFTYTGSKALRDSFRGSRAHNVLLVDGEPSSVPAGPFSWKTIAECEPVSWLRERRFDYVAGRHDGYEGLVHPATHTRSILFLKNDYWIMRDCLSSSGDHNLELRFHFAPGTTLEMEPRGELGNCELRAATETGGRAELKLAVFGRQGSWSTEESTVSQCYGAGEAAQVCTFSAISSANRGGLDEVITMLLPSHEEKSQFQVREVEAIGGRAFEITSPDHSDLIVLKYSRSERVETVRMVSDFNWNWARFPSGRNQMNQELFELLVIDGRRLELDGKEIVKSAKQVSHLMASRVGDRFRVETSEGLLDLNFPIGDLAQLFVEANRQSAIGN